MKGTFEHVRAAVVTDIGRRRKNNEDTAWAMAESGLFGVADGVGGAEGGELVSQRLREHLQSLAVTDGFLQGEFSARLALVRRAVREVREWTRTASEERGVRGMASTLVLLVCDPRRPRRARVLHAGDSRAYLLRAGTLRQLTRDHSVAEASGRAEDTLPKMFRGVITRAVNADLKQELEETRVEISAGDCFLLCSDGLTKMVKDESIRRLLMESEGQPLDARAALLIEQANLAGGVDNVSVVLACFDEAAPAPGDDTPTEDPDQPARKTSAPTESQPTPSTSSPQTTQARTLPGFRRLRFRPVGGIMIGVAVLLSAVGLMWIRHPVESSSSELTQRRDADLASGGLSAEPALIHPEVPIISGPVLPLASLPIEPDIKDPGGSSDQPSGNVEGPPAVSAISVEPAPPSEATPVVEITKVAPGGFASASGEPEMGQTPVGQAPPEEEHRERDRQAHLAAVARAVADAKSSGKWGVLDGIEQNHSDMSIADCIADAEERGRVARWRQLWGKASGQFAEGGNPARDLWIRATEALQWEDGADAPPLAGVSSADDYCRHLSGYFRWLRTACEQRRGEFRLRLEEFHRPMTDVILKRVCAFLGESSGINGNDMVELAQAARNALDSAGRSALDFAESDPPQPAGADATLQAFKNAHSAEVRLWTSIRKKITQESLNNAIRSNPGSREKVRQRGILYIPAPDGNGPNPNLDQMKWWRTFFETIDEIERSKEPGGSRDG